jgi:hypothetical protein
MAKKKVTFETQEDGVSRRASIEDAPEAQPEAASEADADDVTDAPEAQPEAPAKELNHVDKIHEIAQFLGGKKDDDLHKSHGLNLSQVGVIRDCCDRLASKKPFHLSDGNKELIDRMYADLKKRSKI